MHYASKSFLAGVPILDAFLHFIPRRFQHAIFGIFACHICVPVSTPMENISGTATSVSYKSSWFDSDFRRDLCSKSFPSLLTPNVIRLDTSQISPLRCSACRQSMTSTLAYFCNANSHFFPTRISVLRLGRSRESMRR